MDIKRARAGHRRLFTKGVDKAQNLLATDPVNESELTIAMEQISERYSKMTKIDEDVFSVTDMSEEDFNAETDTSEQYSREYHAIKGKIKEHRSKRTGVPRVETSAIASDITTPTATSSVRLPKLTLPFFDGNILEWLPFWDTFKSAVHDRTDLTGAAKFEYLAGQLRGEPATLIHGFQHTSESYDEAVELLDKSYGDKQKIVRGHIYHIFDLTTPRCNAKDLTRYRNEYESHLRSLKVLGINVDAASHVYTALLTRKLPLQTRDNINRATRKTYLDLKELRTAIDEEIERLGIAYEDDLQVRPVENTISSFPTVTSETLACHYCDGNHKAIDCYVYTSVEQRRSVIKSRKLCYNCLSRSHAVGQCRSPWTCSICRLQHHSSVCFKREPRSDATTSGRGYPSDGNSTNQHASTSSSTRSRNTPAGQGPSGNRPQQMTTTTSVNLIRGVTSTILPTAMLGVASRGSVHYVRTLFDQGAQRSFVLKDTVQQLHLQDCVVGQTQMTINGFNSKGQPNIYDVVNIETVTNEGRVSVNVIVVDNLPGNITMNGRGQVVHDIQLKGVQLADPSTEDTIMDIHMIIGADHYFDYVYSDKVDDVAIIPSKIGCLISGRTSMNLMDNSVNSTGASLVVTALHVGATESDDLNTELTRLWSLDTIGITQDTLTNDEIAAVEDFESNVTYNGNCYTARLPWKLNHPALPSNEQLARKRLRSTLSRLRRTQDILDHYDGIIKSHLDKGFIEKVDENAKPATDATIHYLPHHEVKKESATTPIRVVFDCSAKSSSYQPSLNDCLLIGPSLVQELGRMLLLFRLEPYAAIADIEKAFLQVGLAEQDRESTRFFWPENPTDSSSKLNVYRFKVVLFGATCSQFLLNATLRHHLSLSTSQVANKLLERLYVDNLQTSESSEDRLIDFYAESRRLLKEAGFVLREWHTNSPRLNTVIANNGDGMALKSDEPKVVPLLGMRWMSDTDQLSFARKETKENEIPATFTKRYIVSQASKMFDPLGWLTPVLIRSRMYIQKLWKCDLDWDEPISEELCKEWIDIESDLAKTRYTTQERRILITSDTELHCFSDASMGAYGAVVYIVNGPYVQLLISKSRVAPTRSITLPQLELTAANVAAKLTKYVLNIYAKEGLSEDKVHMWSDSQIVLCWIKSDKPLKTYIKNRVDDINTLLPSAKWRHVPTKDNPADLLSRGMSHRAFEKSTLWWEGPDWITHHGTRFATVITAPLEDIAVNENDVIEQSTSDQPDTTHVGLVQTQIMKDVIDVQRYSDYNKLVRVTSYVIKFCDKLREAVSRRQAIADQDTTPHVLDVRDVNRAELYLVKLVQNEYYSSEMQYLRGDQLGKRPNLVKQLRLQLQDDIIRCSGRIGEADLPWETKCPILLPPHHHLTKLLIRRVHEDSKHSGVGIVLTKIRERWWIPAGRQRIKEVMHKCVRCKRQQARPYPTADEPQLPEIRVSDCHPFTVTGVDYTGALLVKDGDIIRKVYISLFTCATTRAIHLEVVRDNKCETFIHALRRFIARRSCPRYMLSDNSSTFVSAAKLLEGFSQCSSLQDEVTWKFIPVRAPWFGGFWERLIGLTKSAIKKTIGKSLVELDELQSLVMEVESVVNNRPQAYFTNDLDEPLPLSPSMLLHGRNLTTIGAGEDEISQLTSQTPLQDLVSRKLRRSEENRVAMKNRWKHEYLTGLREQHAYTRSTAATPKISVGDVVLIHDDSPRINWNLGRIESLNVGNDGEVRSASLKTQHGVSVRPLQRLYPLESQVNLDRENDDASRNRRHNGDDESLQADDNVVDSIGTTINDDKSKSKRSAAIKARENITKWCK